MYLYVNERNEIKSVNTPIEGLTGLYVDESIDFFPFRGWSEAKICCYKVNVNDKGVVTMMTPYLDSRLLDHIDQLGQATEENESMVMQTQEGLAESFELSLANSDEIVQTQEGLVETFEMSANNSMDIVTCEEAIAELYEMILNDVATMIQEALGGNA